MKLNIKINCHSSICINDVYYIDPFKITTKTNNAKIIFITHPHYDHLDMSSIKKLINNNTIIVCTKSSKEIIQKELTNKIIVVEPNQKGKIENIEYSTFPAYNFGHHHFKELGYVGYNLIIDDIKYTICGDTDATEELKQIKTDVLLIPIGGTYTMDAKEAADLTNIMKPKVVIPTHYDCIEGTAKKEAEKIFIDNVNPKIEVVIKIK